MTHADTIKPGQTAVRHYYETLERLDLQQANHELAMRMAFQRLLEDTARQRDWTLVPELGAKIDGRTIRPDGAVRDANGLPRGWWEAKDPSDNLGMAIAQKAAKGYPLTNTIFENTRQAVLFQNRTETLKADLSDPQQLADLLNQFYGHVEPHFVEFEQAVDEFKDRVPELARGLAHKIDEAHSANKPFIGAFEGLYTLCRSSLNPNLSRAAVDEMIVQHLLTERLIRTIFNNPDFVRRNVIAAEVEKVVNALVSKSFDRGLYLKELDRFYVAIEGAAQTLTDYSEKQHFLNTIYERFFQGYSVKVADTHGIVYTPQPVSDFMCASVVEVLREEFGLELSDPRLVLLDPCTGTANFAVNMMRRVPKKDLPQFYRKQLFANEVMLLPYYIAALNIEHAYFELTGEYEPFEGLCFVDTLDMSEHAQAELPFFTQENTQRVGRQKKAKITVLIGNPPYNVGQLNENDNNKNRKYAVVDKRVSETYARDSVASSKSKLSDAYVKFFRWASDRLEGRDGIVCYVTNNGFVDQAAFDGMRKHLLQDFTRIYHLDLHGNVRKNPKLSGTTHNVFGIQVGVGITLAVRIKRQKKRALYYHRVPEFWRREEKCAWLDERVSVRGVDWHKLRPDEKNTWLVPEHADEFASFLPIGSKAAKAAEKGEVQAIFKMYSLGVSTNRDDVVYDFHRHALETRVKDFIEDYNAEVDRYKRAKMPEDVDNFVKYDRIKWSEALKLNLRRGRYGEYSPADMRAALYRPFTKRVLLFDRLINERVYRMPNIFPVSLTSNTVICVAGIGDRKGFGCLAVNAIPSLDLAFEKTQCFPFYVYEEDGTCRRENITDWGLDQFRTHYGDKKIGKWDVFHYIYGILHHQGYREKFADNLKRELPRIPFARDFHAVADAGRKLATLHLDYEKLEPHPLQFVETPGMPLSYRVDDKMRLSKDKTSLRVNASLTLAGIPPETFEYRLGNRSALEWVIDQYQVTTDKRTHIHSDPNRPDDPEYIVRLVGQVVRVSLETTTIARYLSRQDIDSQRKSSSL